MEKRFYFALQNLPDFTLTAYQAIRLSDLGSVCEKNTVFLKQLHSLGLVLDMDFHLYYIYDPTLPDGAKLMIVLMCRTGSENADGKYVFSALSSLAINSCFKLTPLPDVNDENAMEKADERLSAIARYISEKRAYNAVSVVSKKEFFTNANYSDSSEKVMQYYTVSGWEVKKDARMYNALKLLGKYSAPTVLRVDLLPVADPNAILDRINKKGIYANIQAQSAFKSGREPGMPNRDEAASKAASFYDKYFNTMSSSLQFHSFINIFSNTEANCRLLGDVLCSEILENGLIAHACETGTFLPDRGLTSAKEVTDDIFENRKVSAMKCLYTVEEIAPFFSFPYLYPGESVGIRKETDPQLMDGGLLLGEDLNGYEVRFPFDSIAKHAYISGVPGSGKTFSMKHIIHQLSRVGIPFLVFEPAKREYRGLYDVSEDDKFARFGEFTADEKTDHIILFSPKSNSLFPLHINPFVIPVGVSVNEYVSVLHNVFSGAFFWPAPTPMILKKAISRAYEKRGFYGAEIVTEEVRQTRHFPVVSDLFEAFKWIMDNDSFYIGEMQSNIKGVLETRIGSLMQGDIGEVFNVTSSSLPPESWNKRSIILELENLSNEHANFITLLITSLIRLDLKLHPSVEELPEGDPRRVHGLRHVIFFEEAHNLIGKRTEASEGDPESSKTASTKFIKDMLAEVRAYKQGIVIADQLPTALAPEVLKNTSIKIAHRQTAVDERSAIGSVMSADEIQLEMLSKFTSGQGLMTYESKDLSKPFYLQVMPHFDYPDSTFDDVKLAKKLSSTEWYGTVLYNNSLQPRLKEVMGELQGIKSDLESFLSRYDEEIDIAESLAKQPAEDADAASIDEALAERLDGMHTEAVKLLLRLKKMRDSAYGLNNVIKTITENGVGNDKTNEDCNDVITYILSEIAKYTDGLVHIIKTVSVARKYRGSN